MFPLIRTYYFGEVNIAYWEWLLGALYVFLLYVYFARKKTLLIKKAPEYKYYVWGMFAKVFGGMAFTLIYFYYYDGGDAAGYYYSALAMRNLAVENPMEYLNQMKGDNSVAAWARYTLSTGKPLQYLYFEDRTFTVIRMVSVFSFFTFKSFLVTALLVASMSFYGPWACFRTFVSYYPQVSRQLAIAFLFMPSVIFWGRPSSRIRSPSAPPAGGCMRLTRLFSNGGSSIGTISVWWSVACCSSPSSHISSWCCCRLL